MSETRVQVGIVGAGPAGLMLGRLLAQAGVSFVIVERQSRSHVAGRVRAGVLEQGSVALLDRAQVSERLHHEGLVHDGIEIAFSGRRIRVDFRALTGAAVTVYGQTEITRDLNAAHADSANTLLYECTDVSLHDIDSQHPRIRVTHGGEQIEFECAFIAGCDGFHGVSRQSIPAGIRREFERVYPLGWLGVLSDTPPISPELIYANHERGFALCSMRSATRSRYYLQVDIQDQLAAWPDERFWTELESRLPGDSVANLTRGPAIEKSIAPLRSFVAEPMRHGQLFLAGDAAHIVPPTGAKGLNLALADVRVLADALVAFFADGNAALLNGYSAACLRRVWKAQRFSWWFTALTHRLSDDPFQQRLQIAELEYLASSSAAMTALAENYVGLP